MYATEKNRNKWIYVGGGRRLPTNHLTHHELNHTLEIHRIHHAKHNDSQFKTRDVFDYYCETADGDMSDDGLQSFANIR